jgi:gluconolactonase
MRFYSTTAWFLLIGLLTTPAFAQNTTNFPHLGEIVRMADAFDELVGKDAAIEVLGSGFEWAEGPVWVPVKASGQAKGKKAAKKNQPKDDAAAKNGGYLLFSDIPRNSVMRWDYTLGISLFFKPSGYTGATPYGTEPGCNGLMLDPIGRLVSCEHGDRRVSVMTKNGGKQTLVDNYQGKRLNSPNDGCFHKNGDLYFTDPPYGLPEQYNDPRRELDFCGVYRLKMKDNGEHELTLLTKEMTRPNGIAFSPDYKTLYVAQSDPAAAIWKRFEVKDDGTLGEGELLFDATEYVGKHKGLPDGLKVDQAGNLWATGPGGVWVFNADGKPLGRLDTKEATANCGWGDDGSTLYITADMYLCRVKTKTKGAGW